MELEGFALALWSSETRISMRPARPPACAPARQVWLALYNLVVDPAARAKMDLTESRCEALFRLKRHFSEVLLDQVGAWRQRRQGLVGGEDDPLGRAAKGLPTSPAPHHLLAAQGTYCFRLEV